MIVKIANQNDSASLTSLTLSDTITPNRSQDFQRDRDIIYRTTTANMLTQFIKLLSLLSVLALATGCQFAGLGGGAQPDDSAPLQDPNAIVPFTNIVDTALLDGYGVWNDRPGVVIFDYDRDGDMDFYITQMAGYDNMLYRNNGDDTFSDVGAEAARRWRTRTARARSPAM